MLRESSRRARGARWLGWWVLCGALMGCRGSGPGEDAAERPARPSAAAPDAGPSVLGEGETRPAQRKPDGGMPPDAGPFRYELQGVPRPEKEQGPCPAGYHRCCEGSCSPDKKCPGVACDPVPTMPE